MKIMKTQVLQFAAIICLLTGNILYSQTGESKFKMMVINPNERKVAPLYTSFEMIGLDFKDANLDRDLDGKENGSITFYLKNTGTIPLQELNVSLRISDSIKIQGLSFPESSSIKSISLGDSALVKIDLTADDKLLDGIAKFEILVTDSRSDSTENARLDIPTKEILAPPVFTWVTPSSPTEVAQFGVADISGLVMSKSKITLKVYINGQVVDDNRSFEVLTSENRNEVRINRTVFLTEGDNSIMVEAANAQGITKSETRVINYFVQKLDSNYVEKRLALVIGNANYVNSTTLLNPVNDAKAIAVALREVGFTVLMYLNSDLKAMKKALNEFGEKLQDFTVGLFYYAGHGMQVNGNNYLIPVDASLKVEQDVEYDCVNSGQLLGKMEAAGTTTNIVILDACRDNPFERSWATRSAGQAGKGLAFMDAPSGSIIAYATSPGRTASDGTGKNGLYTSALLQFIKIPNLTLLEFFQNVRAEVEKKSNRAQTPWEATSLKGNFFFVIK
jgi:hypothetical protein